MALADVSADRALKLRLIGWRAFALPGGETTGRLEGGMGTCLGLLKAL